MAHEHEVDWSPLRKLARRVLEQGEALALTEETCALLRRSAGEFAISLEDAEDALRDVSTATALLHEVERRMREGSTRLSQARSQAADLEDAGDFTGARKVWEGTLTVEVVPFYRELVQRQLKRVVKVERVAATGHVDATLSPWAQVRVLALRLREGKPLDLRDDLRDFLLRTAAPSVGISEAEAHQALQSMEGAEALLARMLKLIQDGQERITQALSRMMDCREAGDREGALQALRDVLAVEVVPKYRQMAQENLDHFDEPPPEG